MLYVRYGLRGSLYLLLVANLQNHCVLLGPVSTFITKAFIAASRHCVVLWFVWHRLLGLSILVSLSVVWLELKILVTFTRYFSSRVLMTFTLVIVTCFAMSFALRSAPIARLVLDASLLHCTQAAIPTLFVLCFAIRIVCRMRFPLCLLLCTVFLLNAGPSLPNWHCISLSAGFASVWWSFLALFLSCFKHVWH